MAQYVINNIPEPIEFSPSNIIERTLQNAKNLLMCKMFEVPYDRYRGLDGAIYDLPINKIKNELVPELDRLMLYDPDVHVVDAEAKLMENGETLIEVTIDIDIKEA